MNVNYGGTCGLGRGFDLNPTSAQFYNVKWFINERVKTFSENVTSEHRLLESFDKYHEIYFDRINLNGLKWFDKIEKNSFYFLSNKWNNEKDSNGS